MNPSDILKEKVAVPNAIPPNSDLFAHADKTNQKAEALVVQTDTLERTGVLALGAGPSGDVRPDGARALIVGHDPVFRQPVGVYGESTNQGLMGLSTSPTGTGVYGGNIGGDIAGASVGVRGETTSGVGIQGQSFGPGLAGKFIGRVEISESLTANEINAQDIFLLGADYAEDFDIYSGPTAEPGTAMIVGKDGRLHVSDRAYDTRVVGVVAGGGDYRPGVVLDRRASNEVRLPISLCGKCYCKVDASYGGVQAGDLLTTSDTPGHAMKATEPLKAFGALIGKALSPLADGRGLIPIFVVRQ